MKFTVVDYAFCDCNGAKPDYIHLYTFLFGWVPKYQLMAQRWSCTVHNFS